MFYGFNWRPAKSPIKKNVIFLKTFHFLNLAILIYFEPGFGFLEQRIIL